MPVVRSSADDRCERQYAEKPPAYFGSVRTDFVDRLPDQPSARILEVGCGSGATGALALSRKKCARYVGIELDARAASAARSCLTEVIEGNIEQMELPFREASFDALIMGEVLEHLIDPWATLKRLSRLLRPGALILASVPNISHYRVITELIKGRFDHTDSGIMDRTHLRWFTPKSLAELLEHADFDVVELMQLGAPSLKVRLFNSLTHGVMHHLSMAQISILGRKRHGIKSDK